MPKVAVESQTPLAADEAFRRLQTLLESDADLKKLDPSCSFQFNPGQRKGQAQAKMFKATLAVSEHGTGSKVVVEVDLPLMLTPAKGMVQATLERKIGKALA